MSPLTIEDCSRLITVLPNKGESVPNRRIYSAASVVTRNARVEGRRVLGGGYFEIFSAATSVFMGHSTSFGSPQWGHRIP
jgi:hypothetical protein